MLLVLYSHSIHTLYCTSLRSEFRLGVLQYIPYKPAQGYEFNIETLSKLDIINTVHDWIRKAGLGDDLLICFRHGLDTGDTMHIFTLYSIYVKNKPRKT